MTAVKQIKDTNYLHRTKSNAALYEIKNSLYDLKEHHYNTNLSFTRPICSKFRKCEGDYLWQVVRKLTSQPKFLLWEQETRLYTT